MHSKKYYQHSTWMLLFLIPVFYVSNAQTKTLKGLIKDSHSDEIVPFASMRLIGNGGGRLSDSAGEFVFRWENGWPTDTLEVTYVGYKDYKLALSPEILGGIARHDLANLVVLLERAQYAADVIVRHKVDRGLLLWRKIVRRKKYNDRYRFANFSYELYNKLELDLNQVNKDKLRDIKLLKPFGFILNNVDTLQGHPYLPVYLTETLSDYYYQRSPVKRREWIKGSKTMGVDNPSVSKMLGGMEQNVDFYQNFIPVLDKRFVSPLSDNGDFYYHYKVVDTQYVNARRLFHLVFTPKRKGESTFEGDCWVHDTSFAIQKMNLRLNADANINFVNEMSLIQEFRLINDSVWFLSKDKFVVTISPLGKNKLGFIGRKTTTYKNVIVDDSTVTSELHRNKIQEEVLFAPDARNRTDSFWSASRHEELNKNEKAVYQMIDTLLKMPLFQTYTNIVNFIGTGYYEIGKFEIGPWYNWVYSNVLQGTRLRWDLGTNRYFSKKVTFHGYLAYGFGDRRWHGEADALYLFNKDPRFSLYAMYRNDLDYGQQYYDEITSDNIFAVTIRKTGVPIKFLGLEEKKLELFKEWHNGFSITLTGDHKRYDPLLNLPSKNTYAAPSGEPLNTFETTIQLRWAYLEKFFENTFYRTSLGSDYPIFNLKYTRGIAGILNSSYNYDKVSVSISDYIKIPPFGSLYYNVFAGKTFGTLPFPLLDVAPGNELYYYNQYAFNLMNKYEYLHDRYMGLNVEHNFGNGLFRFIGLTRKLKFRQFWTAKALWGGLSDANKAYNYSSTYPFKSLDGKTYLEVGTGVDNIFKFFRVDLVWRLLPQLPTLPAERFGVFGSFRLAF
jgi:hypothetical protein